MIKIRSTNKNTFIIDQTKALLLLVSLIIILFTLLGCQTVVNQETNNLPTVDQEVEYAEKPLLHVVEKDTIMSLLGKNFIEIQQVLGEPDEQGYSEWLGPHNYILYKYEEGYVQFCSPEFIENEVAVNIILGPGQEVFDAKVGMLFPEIISILGSPDYGPEIGMDNLYYMDYFGGEINDQIPEVFISFVAASMNSPTEHVFIKWEAFKQEETEDFVAVR